MSNIARRACCALVVSGIVANFAFASPGVDPRFPIQIKLQRIGGGPDAILQWDTTVSARVIVAGSADAFSRASPSFTSDVASLIEWGPDVPALTTVASCNASLGRYRTEPGPDGTYINPQCVAKGKLFGVSQRGWLYVTSDGTNWTPTSQPPRLTGGVLGLASGTLLSMMHEGGRVALYRSADEGVTWAPALNADTLTPFRWISIGAWLAPFGFFQAKSGVAVMVEYQLPEGARFIYRSADDGATWSVVHDGAAVHPMTHFHAVTKHVALDRWVAITGDGLDRQRIIASDDDAQTWYDLTDPGEFYTQPTFLMDYDHPTRLLIGSDTAEQVGTLDVSSGPDCGQVHSLITNWDARPSHGYSFLMWKYDDVYYAASYITGAGSTAPVISASRDLAHWAAYHRFVNDECGGLTYAGCFNGVMNVGVNSGGHIVPLALPPAELSVRPAVQLSSGARNLAPASLASCESTAGWGDLSAAVLGGVSRPTTIQVVSTPRYEGAGAIRAARTDGGTISIRAPSVELAPGRPVQARIMLRGEGASFSLGWNVNGAFFGDAYLYHLSRDAWIEVVSPTIVLPSNATDARLQFTLTSTLTNRCELLIDAVMVDAGPVSNFHPSGQAPRAPDQYLIDIGPAEADWTHMFSFHPNAASDQMVAAHGNRILRRYQIAPPPPGPGSPDELRQLDIIYNPSLNYFGLRGTATDSSVAVANFPSFRFWRDSQFRFVLRSADDVSLSLANGSGSLDAVILFGTRWAAGPLFAYVGDETGAKQLPGLLHDDIVYPWRLSDAELDHAARLTDASAAVTIDEVVIERSANGGAFAEVWRGLASLLEYSEPAEPGIRRRVYRARAVGAVRQSRPSPPVAIDGHLPADFNADELVNLADVATLQQAFGTCTTILDPLVIWDMNQDRCVNGDDWLAWASYVAD